MNSFCYSFKNPLNQLKTPVYKTTRLFIMMNNNDKIRITEGHLNKYASHAETQRVVLDYAVYFFMFI